ncbi:3-hydroxybutyrate dehydrogenase [Aestuariispira insulae]|uniref:3-hydroxybutyrate dehydrogenase n=1 Tax=Aestuariispira insulae TaxID=1461337 RepID=A0A3D9HJQ8_9PROT|nr:3-hydroxybutyrate dehydrogenase [Aestuariispira insulae]RED49737.1 3-hydroxybutyrate dehydrogenase [Aestuariispira insulae]
MKQGLAALVTGSTSGIGLAMAEALAAEGCAVMLNGLGDKAENEETRARLEEDFGVPVGLSDADMSDPAQIRTLVAETAETFGRLDILVNNAGIQHVSPIEDFPEDAWDKIMAINLSSAFHTTKAALPLMRKQGWGRIVNTASVHGLAASIHKAAYVAAKHGIVGLTKVTALETAEEPITCNAICPGWVRTPLVEKQIEARSKATGLTQEEAARDLLSEKQPSKEFVTPEMLAGLLIFLCSDSASQMTGVSLPMDGGWFAQ